MGRCLLLHSIVRILPSLDWMFRALSLSPKIDPVVDFTFLLIVDGVARFVMVLPKDGYFAIVRFLVDIIEGV